MTYPLFLNKTNILVSMKLKEYKHNEQIQFQFEHLYTGYDYGELIFGLSILAETNCGKVDILFERLNALQTLTSESLIYGCLLGNLNLQEKTIYQVFRKEPTLKLSENSEIEILTKQGINTYYFIKGEEFSIRNRQDYQYTSEWYTEKFKQFLL